MAYQIKVGDMVSPTEGDLAGKMAIVMARHSHGWEVQFTKKVDRRIVRRTLPEEMLMLQTSLEEAEEAPGIHWEAPREGTEAYRQFKWRGLVGVTARSPSDKAYRDATLKALDTQGHRIDLEQTLRAYVHMPRESGGCGGAFDYPHVLLTPGGNALVFRGFNGWDMFYSFEEVRKSNLAAMERVREELEEMAKAKAVEMEREAKARGPYGFQEKPAIDRNSYGAAYQALVKRTDILQTCCLLLAAALQNAATDLDANAGDGELTHRTYHMVDKNTRTVADLLNWDAPESPETDADGSNDPKDLVDG